MRTHPSPKPLGRLPALLLLLFLSFAPAAPAAAQETSSADVVVIVDTSTSMREPGMDPQWASLLVTKLLADIVPGDLAVVRLLDLVADRDVLPSRETGVTEPCPEDPTRMCGVVEPASDWHADARTKKLGTVLRPARGDSDFKRLLEGHLAQSRHNSYFAYAFAAAQGVFDDHKAAGETGRPRTVIWLSDGRSDEPDLVRSDIAKLRADGVAVKAIVFGNGDPALAGSAGLDPLQVSSPAEMMRAFADAFRQIVQAPFRVDNVVSTAPSFQMKPHVDEAWVVVYGDDTLGDVTVRKPDGGEVRADYAADRWAGAGAYRVAYLRRPLPGTWTVQATGGGSGVAYAVVQRSALTPVLLEPERAISGAEVPLVAGVRAGLEGELVTEPEVLAGLTLTAEIQGQTISLLDDGTAPDAVASDGRLSGKVRFRGSGRVSVILHLQSDVVDRRNEAFVEVSGTFRYTGGPLTVDLGRLGVSGESCRELVVDAEHEGEVPFELVRLRRLPSGHRLEVRRPEGVLVPKGDPVTLRPGGTFEVCLLTDDDVPSSEATGEPWLELRVAGSDLDEHRVRVQLVWVVEGLSFWQRWGWLILGILGILALVLLVAGYVVPQRFSGTLALAYGPEHDELDEQSPQPVKQWPGVGIGFYRNARAYLHPDFRLSGKAQGAVAGLYAERGGARVQPGGQSLHRETLDGGWERVAEPGRRVRAGDVYRVGESGPYFRISTHRGR